MVLASVIHLLSYVSCYNSLTWTNFHIPPYDIYILYTGLLPAFLRSSLASIIHLLSSVSCYNTFSQTVTFISYLMTVVYRSTSYFSNKCLLSYDMILGTWTQSELGKLLLCKRNRKLMLIISVLLITGIISIIMNWINHGHSWASTAVVVNVMLTV